MSVDYVKANQNIVQDTKDLALSQFSDATQVQKLIEIVAEEAQSYEEVAESVFTTFLLTQASGFSLDSIGEFLNIPRQDQTDEEYRTSLIFSAIGANSNVSRDSLANLLNIATGGVGGYFYNGSFHDLYVYLQESCIEQGVAAEFLEKYLPVGTNTSIIFESGRAFGFENNDAASGFDTVRSLSSSGTALISYDVGSDIYEIEPEIPKGYVFRSNAGDEYRTEEDFTVLEEVIGVSWAINGLFSAGDNLTVISRSVEEGTCRGSGELVAASTDEIVKIIAEGFCNELVNNPAALFVDDVASPKVYLGYEQPVELSDFGSRNSQATQIDEFGVMTLVGNDVARVNYAYGDGELLYENYSKNIVTHSSDYTVATGAWTRTANLTSAVESSLRAAEDATRFTAGTGTQTLSYASDITIGASEEGTHTLSFFLKSTANTVAPLTLEISSETFDYDLNTLEFSNVSTEFERVNTRLVADDYYRVEATIFLSEGTHSLQVISPENNEWIMFGAQPEPWFYATSYMPTSGAVFERAADYLNLASVSSVVGTSNEYFVRIDSPTYSNLVFTDRINLSSVIRDSFVIEEGDAFGLTDPLEFSVNSVIAESGWTVGFPYSLQPANSTADSGAFADRASLTITDVVALSAVADIFEYELDSKFFEIVGVFDETATAVLRPIQVVEQFDAFRPPLWDSALTGQAKPNATGYALRSPEGVDNYAAYQDGVQELALLNADSDLQEPFSLVKGDLDTPNKAFYFEMEYTTPPVASSTVSLNGFVTALDAFGIPADQNSGVQVLDLHSMDFDITCDYLLTDEFRVEVEARYDSEVTESVDGSVTSQDKTSIVSKPYSQTYAPLSPPASLNFGILVEVTTGVVRLYVDGVPYDGAGGTGKLLVTSVSDGDFLVGDEFVIQRIPDKILAFVLGSTNNDEPEPTSVEDQGTLSWIYDRANFKYTSQLPQDAVDIFGRLIQQN